jgi:two-component system, OmpR family, sensor kinase
MTGRRRLRTPTLRTQLVALLMILLVVAFALVAVVTAVALRKFLTDRLDEQLRAATDRFAASLAHHDSDADDTTVTRPANQAPGTLGARVVNGQAIAAEVIDNKQGKTKQVGPAGLAVLGGLTKDETPHTIDLPGFGDYRVIVSPAPDGDLLVTGLSSEPIEDTIGQLALIEGIVFAAALIITSVGGAFFVRAALRPLTEMADTAATVADLPLASGAVSLPERAPPAHPGTELGTMSDALNHLLEHVESSLHARQLSEERLRRFIADASHELRTPVAVVRSHAEYAQRTSSQLPAPITKSLERIVAESDRMGHLVNDLLLLARLDSGRPLARDEVDLTRLVLDAVSDARIAGRNHVWTLELPAEPVIVLGDEHALHQVVANLLANARTHTPTRTVVHASIRTCDERGETQIVITDNGPGIPDAVKSAVFERFVRGHDSRSHTEGSTGLGLSIVSAIVRAHHGRIDLTSRPGETTFTITLASAPESTVDAGAPED